MYSYTKDDIMKMVAENDVRFIRLQFTDIFGTLKNVAINRKYLKFMTDLSASEILSGCQGNVQKSLSSRMMIGLTL